MSTNKKWLNLSSEKTLEPDLPICDPHHHFWEFRYDRVADRYLLDEIQADLGTGHNIVSTVFIECGSMYRAYGPEEMRPVGETEFVNGIAAMSASGLYGKTQIAAGVVGQADLCLGGKVAAVLDAHLAAGGGRFRGVRRQANWDASEDIHNGRFVDRPHIYMEDSFRQGFAELAKRELSFEAWCFHTQIGELISLAQKFPKTKIILNHFGGPLGVGPYAQERDAIFSKWRKDIAELATCPNVFAKLGGINMEINGFDWHLQDRPPSSKALMESTRAYYEHTIEHFGCERCMFESNFPVDMVSCSYNTLWNSFKRLTANYGEEEKANLFHDTASEVYRIGD